MTNDWFTRLPADLASKDFASHVLNCEGPLAPYCRALVAVEVEPAPDLSLSIIPHDSVMLSLTLARGRDPFMRGAERGELPQLCAYREDSLSYRPSGDCLTFFAMLTPQGAIAITGGQALDASGTLRQPLANLMERYPLVQLEDRMVAQPDIASMLRVFAHWLEDAVVPRRALPWQSRRAARIASLIMKEPSRTVQSVADAEGVNRRQLERDFRRWLNTSPKHAGAVARVQAVARLAGNGLSLADTAASLGFTDQSHMNRTVKLISGVSPLTLARTAQTPLSRAFRRATGGGVVYL